ncbi:hypothetical protein [Amycolatopsis samaneae]|uniref:ESX-1 secretion-associated protein n=1 Tax=Amycolatopsis samaneae TaxID=664691 RepID=A0ABW5GTW1_9PSEU
MDGTTWEKPGSAAGDKPSTGDAGKNYLNDLLNPQMDAAGARRIATGGDELKKMAETGGFAINEAGLQTYLKACDKFLEGYDYWKGQLQVLTLPAKMGGSQYAGAVANFNVKVANGDKQALLPNLDLMAEGIKTAREALLIARKNYRETEERHNVTFAKLNKERDHQ